MHITSNVTVETPNADAFDALRACLPAGTVSAVSKSGRWKSSTNSSRIPPRARMPERSATSTSTATWTPALPLRTIVVQGNQAYVQAGAGIVADSVPAEEYQETLNKARGLLKAIEISETTQSTSEVSG